MARAVLRKIRNTRPLAAPRRTTGGRDVKPGLELPALTDKALHDLHVVGKCIICHTMLYSFDPDAEAQTYCKGEPCEHPDELCNDPECLHERKRLYRAGKKLKNPCKFPKLRDQP